uniref:Uncharacterized protein n=1 Tax=Arundo donax TaxID=35708 RepID=A0A0A9HRP9_ARUDO
MNILFFLKLLSCIPLFLLSHRITDLKKSWQLQKFSKIDLQHS